MVVTDTAQQPERDSRPVGLTDGSSAYLRLSTRPVDQTLAAVPADPAARERRSTSSPPSTASRPSPWA
jgi:pyruvate dehydrogenase E1 component